METIDKETATDLVTIVALKKEQAMDLFQPNGCDPLLSQIEAEVKKFTSTVYDMNKAADRKAVASNAYKIAQSKTALENLGKECSAKAKELPKIIDAERNRVKKKLESWQTEVRKPLDEWEAEQERIAQEKKAREASFLAKIETIKCLANDAFEFNVQTLEMSLTALDKEFEHNWEEFAYEATNAYNASKLKLTQALQKRKDDDAKTAELEALRAKQAEQERVIREREIADQAAAKAKADAEAQIEREKQQAENQRLQLELAKKQAEEAKVRAEAQAIKAKKDAEAKALAAVEAEKARVAAETQRIKDEEAKREADVEHRRKVNREAAQALIDGGMSDKAAMEAIRLIAKGVVPNVTINY